jgi:hypothetical protein
MTDTPIESAQGSTAAAAEAAAKPPQDAAPATSPEQARELLTERLGNFIAACGADDGDYSFSEFSSRPVAIDARYVWKLEVKVEDEQADTDRMSKLAFMSSGDLDRSTIETRQQFQGDTSVLATAVDRERDVSFHALCKMLSKVNVIAKKELYGYASCPRCHGSRYEKCRSCSGTGRVKCPDCGGKGDSCPRCQGTGYLSCPECTGRGTTTCTKCHGKGLTGVRRTITQKVTRSCSFSYQIGQGKDATDGSELPDQDRKTLCDETPFEQVRL